MSLHLYRLDLIRKIKTLCGEQGESTNSVHPVDGANCPKCLEIAKKIKKKLPYPYITLSAAECEARANQRDK